MHKLLAMLLALLALASGVAARRGGRRLLDDIPLDDTDDMPQPVGSNPCPHSGTTCYNDYVLCVDGIPTNCQDGGLVCKGGACQAEPADLCSTQQWGCQGKAGYCDNFSFQACSSGYHCEHTSGKPHGACVASNPPPKKDRCADAGHRYGCYGADGYCDNYAYTPCPAGSKCDGGACFSKPPPPPKDPCGHQEFGCHGSSGYCVHYSYTACPTHTHCHDGKHGAECQPDSKPPPKDDRCEYQKSGCYGKAGYCDNFTYRACPSGKQCHDGKHGAECH